MRGLIVLSALFLFACQKETAKLDQYSSYNCVGNESKTYYLCTKKVENSAKSNEPSGTEYAVVDKNGTEIKKGSIESGHVKWLDGGAIEIFETPGNISTEQTKDDITRVLVIKSGETLTKTKYLESN